MSKDKDKEHIGPNPSRYREMSQPQTKEALDAAIEEFYKGVGELRVKCKLADVTIIVRSNALTSDGDDEIPMMSSMHLGNGLEQEAMLARVLGSVQSSRNEMIGKLLKHR